MIILQIIGFIAILIILFLIIRNVRREGVELTNALLGVLLFILLILIVLPEQLETLLQRIGFFRPLDAFLVLVAAGSLVLSVRVYLKEKEMDRNITKIVQSLAIKGVKKEKHEKK